jgi:hypothetical protein
MAETGAGGFWDIGRRGKMRVLGIQAEDGEGWLTVVEETGYPIHNDLLRSAIRLLYSVV